MSGTGIKKLLTRLFTLGVLVTCLAVFSPGVRVETTRAATCCSTCSANYGRCLTRVCGCTTLSPGLYDCQYASQSCVAMCQLHLDQCEPSCDQGC